MLGAAYIGSPRPHDRLHARLRLQLHPQVGQPVYSVRKPGLRIRIRSQLFTLMRIRPAFHFNADSDPDPDPQVLRICDYWSSYPSGLHFDLYTFIVSVNGPLRLPFELPKLLNFDLYADPDPQPWRKPKISEDQCRTGFFALPNEKTELFWWTQFHTSSHRHSNISTPTFPHPPPLLIHQLIHTKSQIIMILASDLCRLYDRRGFAVSQAGGVKVRKYSDLGIAGCVAKILWYSSLPRRINGGRGTKLIVKLKTFFYFFCKLCLNISQTMCKCHLHLV